MRRVGIFAAFVLLFLASCAGATETLAPPLLAPITAHVDTAIVTRGEVSQVNVMTAITRNQTEAVRLVAAGGRLGAVYVWPGETVYEGQLLATMDTERLMEQIEEQEENLRSMDSLHRINVERMHTSAELLEVSHGEASFALGLNPTEANLNRVNDLYEALEWARLDIEHATERHSALRRETLTQLDRLYETLYYTDIRAPFDGDVVFSSAAPGDWLNRLDPIMYIARPGDVFFEYVGNFVVPGGVRISVRFTTFIDGVNHELEVVPASVEENLYYERRGLAPPIRFTFKDPTVTAEPGAQAFIRFYSVYLPDALRIPRNALFLGGVQGMHVYRIENGEQVLVPVTVGAQTDSFVSIVEGLNEGDEVFVRP